MFDKEYSFIGAHAEKVKQLTAQFGENSSAKFFQRYIDVYIVAPIIGFLYGRKSQIDKTKTIDPVDKTEKIDTAKIFIEQLQNEKSNIEYNYQLIMLLDSKNETSFEERINKAFRYYQNKNNAQDEQLFQEYVRGGVDLLYEKLIKDANSNKDYINNLYNFIKEFDERYNRNNQDENIEDILKELGSD